MTEYRVFLPFNDKEEFNDPAFHWLCFHMKDKFEYNDTIKGSLISFTLKEDMQHFILMWGEYL